MTTSKTLKLYRQGDVLVREVASLPKDLKEIPRDNGRIVLAYGEVTGHAHAIHSEAARFLTNEATLERFLEVKKPVALHHEEHDIIELKSGVFEVVIQREWSPEAVRNVAD